MALYIRNYLFSVSSFQLWSTTTAVTSTHSNRTHSNLIMSSDEARLKSRSKFLAKYAGLRTKANEKLLEEDLLQLQEGVGVPTTSVELAVVENHARALSAVHKLDDAVSHRNIMLGESDAMKLEEKNAKRPRVEHLTLTDVVGETLVLDRASSVSSSTPNFTPLAREEILERIHKQDFVKEKTEDEIRHERVQALQEQHKKILEVRRSLPIFKYRSELVSLIKNNQVVVIIGETGSGKTTQLLQYVFEEGMSIVEGEERMLVCTQPRRIAAMSVAERVAKEMNQRCGGLVGYKVRFDDKTSEATRIAFVTDGIMLKEMMNDPNLSKYAAIMIDEAHERSLNSDILLGLMKTIIRRNPHLRVIIASATIQADKFCNFFNGAPKFKIEGRTFPVDLFYSTEAVADYVAGAADAAMDLHLTKPIPGDILIFLPGQEDIEACAALLQEKAAALGGTIRELLILPIYASLPPHEQRKIYQPTPAMCRKVVIATNIAETSITIDGVVYVIDGGLCKQDFYNPKTMMDELALIPTSKASAEQRRGRAGRTQKGECLRLYTKFMYESMDPETKPEILRTTISAVVLQLKSLGINNLVTFDFLDAPSADAIQRSLDHLYLLGALDGSGALTKTGFRMSEFPMDPSMSKMLLKSAVYKCARHMAMAAAVLSLDNSLFLPCRKPEDKKGLEHAREKLFALGNGDVFGYIRIFEEWLLSGSRAREFEQVNFLNVKSLIRAREVFDQILSTFDRWGLEYKKSTADDVMSTIGGKGIDIDAVTRSLVSGYFPNVAVLGIDGTTYAPVRPVAELSRKKSNSSSSVPENVAAAIHPSSFLYRAGQMSAPKGAVNTSDRAAALEAIPPVLRERPSLVLFTSLRLTKQDAPPFMIHVTSLSNCLDLVLECSPANYFTKAELTPGPKKRLP